MTADARIDAFPGAELVEARTADLAAGRESIEGLLIAVASERLRELGRTVPDFGRSGPEARLYAIVEAQVGPLTVRQFDFYAQALAKLERGFSRDIADGLHRFPTVDPDRLRSAVAALEGPRA